MDQDQRDEFVDEQNICFCAGAFPRELQSAEESEPRVVILGTDGWKRRWLARAVSKALGDLGEAEPIQFSANPADLDRYFVLGIPTLVINGTVVSVGCVLSRREARTYLERYL